MEDGRLAEDALRNTLKQGYNWLIILLAVGISIVPSLLVSFATKSICRTKVHHKHSYDTRTPSDIKTIAMTTPFKRGSLKRRSSYAFSHKEGYGEIVTKGTSLHKASTSGEEPAEETTVPQTE